MAAISIILACRCLSLSGINQGGKLDRAEDCKYYWLRRPRYFSLKAYCRQAKYNGLIPIKGSLPILRANLLVESIGYLKNAILFQTYMFQPIIKLQIATNNGDLAPFISPLNYHRNVGLPDVLIILWRKLKNQKVDLVVGVRKLPISTKGIT